MKFNFKKISAIATSALMLGMTMGVAAAANYPTPFLDSPAIVYGTGSGVSTLDQVYSTNINVDLTSRGGTSSGTSSTVSGGDSVLLAKSSDNINLGDNLGVFTGTVDDGDLKTLLIDGTYVADDNDEFKYEQSIKVGSPQFEHFRDSDYESLVGLDSKTPTLGFKIKSSTWVMNYTLDFTTDAESDIVGGDLDDIEGSDLTLLGKIYYVSNFDNSTTTAGTVLGPLTLLDSANEGTVSEGESVTVDGKSVSIDYIDNDEVAFIVDGTRYPSAGKLNKGDSIKLGDSSYLGVRDISKLEVSGEIGSATFSIGAGKLKMTSGSDIELNDVTVQGVKGWVYAGTDSAGAEKVDKIVIEWKTDDEVFLTPESELLMPGFEAIKFTMAEVMRPEEEKVTIEKDSDSSIQLNMPIKDGDVSINLIYANASGEFDGLGKAADDRLATSGNNSLYFHEKFNGNDFHSYFVATYNISTEAESYLLRAKVVYDSSDDRNETTIEKYSSGAWVDANCNDKVATGTCTIGDVSLTINAIEYKSGGNETVKIEGGTDVNFNTVYTPGGLRIYLPYDIALPTSLGGQSGTAFNDTTLAFTELAPGAMNLTLWQNATSIRDKGDAAVSRSTTAGHSSTSFHLQMYEEDKDDNLASGTMFNLTVDDNSDGNMQVTQLDGTGSGGSLGLEVGDTSTYEAYQNGSAVATRILHYTKPDEDWAEVYYPSGNSESYAEVYLAEVGASISSGTTGTTVAQIGNVVFMDSETSSYADMNVIIVGGSCINSAAAKVLGLSAGTCSAAWTTATGVGAGQYLIQGFASSTVTSKHAILVAGYEVAETKMATDFLTHQTVDTSKKYIGTSATTATVQTEEVTTE